MTLPLTTPAVAPTIDVLTSSSCTRLTVGFLPIPFDVVTLHHMVKFLVKTSS